MTVLRDRTEPYSQFGPVWIDEDDYVSLTIHLDPPMQFVENHPELRDYWEEMIQNMSSEEWKCAAEKYMCALIDNLSRDCAL